MSVDAYLADLRAALGNRLPPALKEARLRETRGHLLASAEEVGEVEAIRRYGRPHAIANNLVRAHRGYDARSIWHLALPVAGTYLLFWGEHRFAALILNEGRPFLPSSASAPLFLLFVLAFVVRVFQTRRWLAGPMVAAMALFVGIRIGVRQIAPTFDTPVRGHVAFVGRRDIPEETPQIYARAAPWVTPRGLIREAGDAFVGLAMFAILWLTLNTAALGLAELSDRRRVRCA